MLCCLLFRERISNDNAKIIKKSATDDIFATLMKIPLQGLKSAFLLLFPLVFLLSSCDDTDPRIIPDEILEDVETGFRLERLDLGMRAAAEALEAEPSISDHDLYISHLSAYRPFIVEYLYAGEDSLANDSLIAADFGWVLRDSIFRSLIRFVTDTFPADYPFAKRLEKPLKRFKYVFPERQIPKFATYISGYPQSASSGTDQVQITGSYFGFGLHYFLGPDFKFYPQDMPSYMKRQLRQEYLEKILFAGLAEMILPPVNRTITPRLLDGMIREGKKMYFLQIMLPEVPDSVLMNYSAEQRNWAIYHEARIYKLLLEHLYKTDMKAAQDYLGPKPYTTELALNSAPRIGQFCGWMIVRAYMDKKREISLPELMAEEDADKILKGAGYKPEMRE